MPKYDYSLLRGRIRELFGSEKNFSIKLRKSQLKMSIGTFNSRINGNTYFKQSEMDVICELLRIKLEEIVLYFFTRKYEFNSYKQK